MSAPGTTATLANWRTAPFSRQAFRNIAGLMQTATISNDVEHPARWQTAFKSLQDFKLPLPGGESLGLDDFLRRTRTDGFLVIADGQIAFEWLDEGMQADTTHILMSATKSVVGLLCGVLAGQGVLDVDALASHYVPEIAHTGFAGATVRQLMDMRTDPGFDGADLKSYAASTGWEPRPADGGATGLHRFYVDLPARKTTHGGVFRYISANTDLLGWVIERATGRSLAESLGTHLWRPMGAEHPAAITLDFEGAPRATGGLCATLRDFARVGQLVVDGGTRNGRQVVPATWIDDIAEQGDREAWAQGEFAQAFGRLPMHYRSGWYVIDSDPKTLFAMGIHGQHLFVDRARRLVIAKLSSQAQPLDAEATGLTLRALGEVRRLLATAA